MAMRDDDEDGPAARPTSRQPDPHRCTFKTKLKTLNLTNIYTYISDKQEPRAASSGTNRDHQPPPNRNRGEAVGPQGVLLAGICKGGNSAGGGGVKDWRSPKRRRKEEEEGVTEAGVVTTRVFFLFLVSFPRCFVVPRGTLVEISLTFRPPVKAL